MDNINDRKTVTYTISLPGYDVYSVSGRIKRSNNRVFKVTGEYSVLGGLKAIEAAYAEGAKLKSWSAAPDFSPVISPNPAAELYAS